MTRSDTDRRHVGASVPGSAQTSDVGTRSRERALVRLVEGLDELQTHFARPRRGSWVTEEEWGRVFLPRDPRVELEADQVAQRKDAAKKSRVRAQNALRRLGVTLTWSVVGERLAERAASERDDELEEPVTAVVRYDLLGIHVATPELVAWVAQALGRTPDDRPPLDPAEVVRIYRTENGQNMSENALARFYGVGVARIRRVLGDALRRARGRRGIFEDRPPDVVEAARRTVSRGGSVTAVARALGCSRDAAWRFSREVRRQLERDAARRQTDRPHSDAETTKDAESSQIDK